MKNKMIIWFYCILSTSLFAQVEHINFPYGTSPRINGFLDSGEWDDADTIIINIVGETVSTKVVYKHDKENINMVFVGNMVATPNRFPEILFDMDNDKSETWQSDDWWFHVSNGDCYYKGEYGNYSNCRLTQPDWKAKNNFQNNPKAVEIQIPFETIGLNISDTIGISFLTNDFKVFNMWPEYANHLKPVTWANATFSLPVSTKEDSLTPEIKLYPNPTNNMLFLESIDDTNYQIEIFNAQGKFQKKIEAKDRITSIDLDDFVVGVYFMKIKSNDTIRIKTFLKIE